MVKETIHIITLKSKEEIITSLENDGCRLFPDNNTEYFDTIPNSNRGGTRVPKRILQLAGTSRLARKDRLRNTRYYEDLETQIILRMDLIEKAEPAMPEYKAKQDGTVNIPMILRLCEVAITISDKLKLDPYLKNDKVTFYIGTIKLDTDMSRNAFALADQVVTQLTGKPLYGIRGKI